MDRIDFDHDAAESEGGTATAVRAENLMDLMREACKVGKSPDDAVNVARQWLREDSEMFDLLVEPMILAALRRYAHEVRHRSNRSIRQEVKAGGPSDSFLATLTTAPAVMRSVLDITTPLGHKRIGDCIGTELPAVAEKYREQGRGSFNMAILCDKLARMAGEKRVRDAVDATKANRVWETIVAE